MHSDVCGFTGSKPTSGPAIARRSSSCDDSDSDARATHHATSPSPVDGAITSAGRCSSTRDALQLVEREDRLLHGVDLAIDVVADGAPQLVRQCDWLIPQRA